MDQKALSKANIDVEVIEAKGHYLAPGIIDPHCHSLGGSGENGGFARPVYGSKRGSVREREIPRTIQSPNFLDRK